MPATIIGPIAQLFPKTVYPPIVEVKPTWGDDWQISMELELVSCQLSTPAHDLSQAQFSRRYGTVKQPWQGDYATAATWGTSGGWWVRVRIVGDQGLQTIWIGRIAGQNRNVYGSAAGPVGVQGWVAYGPMQILRKIAVSNSYWWDDVQRRKLAWCPSINDRDDRNMIVGNRSADKHDGIFLYGGDEVWSHYDFLEYLLDIFVDETDGGGPSWSIGGQADLLRDFSENIRMDTTRTVDQLLAEIIPIRFGVDYKIVHDDDSGFEISVYALSAREYSFGEQTLPKNPNTVSVRSGETRDNLETRVVETDDHRYGRIRILGKRVVVCCSLAGAEYQGVVAATLVKKWDDPLEASYKDGTGAAADPNAAQDAVRKRDLFRPVFQHFGAPVRWFHQMGRAAPYIDAAGQVEPVARLEYQNQIRRTLSWIPLREGFDYSQDPPVDHNLATYMPEFRSCSAWLLAEPWTIDHPDPDSQFSKSCEAASIGVSAAQTDWGVCLSASPNHRLAKNHWFPARGTEHPPVFDYERLVATIAFESDQRLRLELEIPDAKPSDGTLDIEVPDAELWYLAPQTVVDVKGEHELLEAVPVTQVFTSGDTGRVLRNDVDRLAMVMAGAIARYGSSRLRGTITIKGLVPWGALLGQILTVIEEGGDTHRIEAPITSVAWMVGDKPRTIISTGFAQ